MKQFVAMSDEQLYRAEGPPLPLVPYKCGVFCWHQLREEAMALPSSDVLAATSNSGGEWLAASA